MSEGSDRNNIIVEGSKILGDMITEANLRIDGEILGNVTSASKVVIGANGRIKGNLTCLDADIEGNIEGTLMVEKLLCLRATANVNGEITTARIQIDEGAQFSGNCKMSNIPFAKHKTLVIPTHEMEENVAY